jgi:Zn-dependent peptidase ImmA (M78 family)
MYVDIKPELFCWARERAGLAPRALTRRFPKLPAWENGQARPTLRQLERFAKATHAPIGFFFLSAPPLEKVPIPDFRTAGNIRIGRPSADLLDTLYLCQQRQEWYRDFMRLMGERPLGFVGSASLASDIRATASAMRHALGFDIEERRQIPTWTEALRRFIEMADALGVLAMVSGVAGSNNKRNLDPREFRGFSLSDPLAPLVFINGADSKAAQMFTLAHELAHIWLGESSLSDVGPVSAPTHQVEVWCNQVAAELLVPMTSLQSEYRKNDDFWIEINRLARIFKVSTLVILRRIFDAGGLTQEGLDQAYDREIRRLNAMPKGSGGNFYLTLAARVSRRFARALVVSTLEGQTLHRDAFQLLGSSKLATFHDLGKSLGVFG